MTTAAVTTPAPATFNEAAQAQTDYAALGIETVLTEQGSMVMHALGPMKYEQNFRAGLLTSTASGATERELFWTAQVNMQTPLNGSNIVQQWWSPKWAKSTGDVYTNFICQYTNGGAYVNEVRNTPSNLQDLTAGKVAAATLTQGSAVTGITQESKYSTAAAGSEGWFTFNCSGYRNFDTAIANVAALEIGAEVAFIGGFKVKQGSAATADLKASAPLTEALMFTIMESNAVALTVSAAVAFLAVAF